MSFSVEPGSALHNNLKAWATKALPNIEAELKNRFSRANLKPGVSYVQHKGLASWPVGKFVRSYYQGSGEGMEMVCVFDTGEVREDMWGSPEGKELTYFTEA